MMNRRGFFASLIAAVGACFSVKPKSAPKIRSIEEVVKACQRANDELGSALAYYGTGVPIDKGWVSVSVTPIGFNIDRLNPQIDMIIARARLLQEDHYLTEAQRRFDQCKQSEQAILKSWEKDRLSLYGSSYDATT